MRALSPWAGRRGSHRARRANPRKQSHSPCRHRTQACFRCSRPSVRTARSRTRPPPTQSEAPRSRSLPTTTGALPTEATTRATPPVRHHHRAREGRATFQWRWQSDHRLPARSPIRPRLGCRNLTGSRERVVPERHVRRDDEQFEPVRGSAGGFSERHAGLQAKDTRDRGCDHHDPGRRHRRPGERRRRYERASVVHDHDRLTRPD
jgi:hypothetical protein